MTVTVIAERPRRTGSISLLGDADTEQRVFICSVTSGDVSGVDLSSAVGLPRKWDAHPRDPRLTMLGMSYQQQDKAPRYIEVTCDYGLPSSESGGGGGGGGEDSPVALRPEVTWDGTTYQKAASGSRKAVSQAAAKGAISEGIVNSAGEVYDPPFEFDEDYPTCHIRRAERVYSAFKILKYSGAINSDDFVIDGERIEKLKAKMGSIRIGPVEYDPRGAQYRWVEYAIVINDDTWIIKPLDYGSYYLDTDGVTKIPFNVKGHLTSGKLNGAGRKLLDGDPEVFLEFHVRREVEFQALQLPSVSI